MKNKYIKILLLGLLSCAVILFNNITALGEFYFYFIFIFLIIDIVKKREITLLHIWNAGFLYIILSEVFLPYFNYNQYSLPALQYLLVANNLVITGYIVNSKKRSYKKKTIYKKDYKVNKITPFFIFLFLAFYVSMTIKSALLVFAFGRHIITDSGVNEGFFGNSIISSIGLILPSIISYYYLHIRKTKIITPFIIASPIFLILFMGGTRFPLLYSFLGFVMVAYTKNIDKIDNKKKLILILSFFLLFAASEIMAHQRSTTTRDNKFELFDDFTGANKGLPYLFAENASAEGIVDMTSLMFQHFENNEHLYGKSTSFILYFWIPRDIWPNKPTMLGYWFIRIYRGGFSDGHSASFGFTGDLYADFGLYSLFFVLLLGMLLKTADEFRIRALKSKSYQTILGAMLYPYIFFFVRSPITSTMSFLGIVFFYHLFKRLMFRNK